MRRSLLHECRLSASRGTIHACYAAFFAARVPALRISRRNPRVLCGLFCCTSAGFAHLEAQSTRAMRPSLLHEGRLCASRGAIHACYAAFFAARVPVLRISRRNPRVLCGLLCCTSAGFAHLEAQSTRAMRPFLLHECRFCASRGAIHACYAAYFAARVPVLRISR